MNSADGSTIVLVRGARLGVFPSLEKGVLEAASARGATVRVLNLERSQLAEEVAELLREAGAAGVLCEVWFWTDPIQEACEALGMPIVYLNQAKGALRVRPDDRGAAYALTRRLVELGHRRILYVDAIRFDNHISHVERRRGYIEAMRGAGLRSRLCEPPITTRMPTEERERYLTETLLRAYAADGPTAVLCYNGYFAEIVCQCAREWFRVRIPEELSVLAILAERDEPGAMVDGRRTDGALVPMEAMGREALALVLEAVRGETRIPRDLALPFPPLAGDTAAPPPPGHEPEDRLDARDSRAGAGP